MESTFDTTAWVLQSLLIMFAVLLVIPFIKAVVGLTLISVSAALGLEQSHLRTAGVSMLPKFMRTALGFATVVALAQPQMASAAEQAPIIIDRVTTSQASQVVAPMPSPPAASTPTPTPSSPSGSPSTKPRIIVFDDDEMNPSPSKSDLIESSGDYVVQVGDSLWTIARSLIDEPQPSARSIDRAWRTIWEANRAVIGSDPSLIRPGTRLQLNRDDILNNSR